VNVQQVHDLKKLEQFNSSVNQKKLQLEASLEKSRAVVSQLGQSLRSKETEWNTNAEKFTIRIQELEMSLDKSYQENEAIQSNLQMSNEKNSSLEAEITQLSKKVESTCQVAMMNNDSHAALLVLI
jgi:septal ring factor EnvC (AmiA/AmiB activator)